MQTLYPGKLQVSVFHCRLSATLRVFRFYSLIFVKYRGHNKCLMRVSHRSAALAGQGEGGSCGECPVMNNTTASPKIGKQIAAQNRVVSHRGTPEHFILSIECSSAAHEGTQMACYIMPNQHIIPMSMTSY